MTLIDNLADRLRLARHRRVLPESGPVRWDLLKASEQDHWRLVAESVIDVIGNETVTQAIERLNGQAADAATAAIRDQKLREADRHAEPALAKATRVWG